MDDDLEFKVETWTARGAVERVLARASSVLIGRGAFDAAVIQYPHCEITLRTGARVVAKHKADATASPAVAIPVVKAKR